MGAVFSVAMALGLRLGEALDLFWTDVDFDRKTLRVCRELLRLPKADGDKHARLVLTELKAKKSRRVLSLGEFAVDMLRGGHRVRQLEERLMAGGDWKNPDLVLTSTVGTFVDERNLRRQFSDVLKQAELPPMRFSDLRHTCASLLLAQGVHPTVVQELLGHSQITLTLDTYSHVLPGLAQDAAAKIDAALQFDPETEFGGRQIGRQTARTHPDVRCYRVSC